MTNELNDLVVKIENHFKECIWQFAPPIQEIDFNFVLLSQKIIDLRNNLDNVKDVDIAISYIMTWMESVFHIPLINEKEWINKNRTRHQLIWDIYSNLSNLRSI